METEQVDGRYRGDDDGEGGGEALQDVVGVLHHDGHQQPAKRLVKDDTPHHVGVAVQEAALGDGGAIAPPHPKQAEPGAKYPQLHVPDPDRSRAPLQDLLEVNTGESRRQAADHHGDQTHGVVLTGAVRHRRLLVPLLLHLQGDKWQDCVSAGS